MRTLILALLMLALGTSLGPAQEDYIGPATSALQDVLSNLQQSVQRLSADNAQLNSRDNDMKAQIAPLQQQLKALQDQGEALHQNSGQLPAKNPGRTQQIDRLEKENEDLDDRIQSAQEQLKTMDQSLRDAGQEHEQLLMKWQNIAGAPAPALSVDQQTAGRWQKEKLRLMKMIYDSQQRQVLLHQAIRRFSRNRPPALYPQLSEETLQVRRMEMQLKTLENNYLKLKDLMGQVAQRSGGRGISVDERVQEGKLQGHIQKLQRQGQALRVDLDELRSQMVDLDKRKSRLEHMIRS